MPSTGGAEHLAGGDRVDVLAIEEGLAQGFHLRDVGGQAQLDLAVIDRQQAVAVLGHEGAADLASLLGADRDVLQIGIGGGQASGRGHGLAERGVHAPGLGVDLLLQRVGVGALELGEMAPVEHPGRQVVALGGQAIEDIGAGRVGAALGALAAGQAELVEQNLAELLGRGDVERAPGETVYLGLEGGDSAGEIVGQAAQFVAVDLDAAPLHLGQHRHQGTLQGLVDRGQALGRQARLEYVIQAQGHVGVLGGVVERRLQRHLVEGHPRLAGAGHILELDGLDAEVQARQLVHAVAVLSAVEHVGQQHGVVDGRDRNPVAGEHEFVVLDVLADLEHARVLEQRLERGQRRVQRNLLGRLGRALQIEACRRPWQAPWPSGM